MEHHANLLLGERRAGEVYLQNIFSELGIVAVGNPDVHFVEADVFLVDDARRLSEEAQVKSFGTKKIFVIVASRFTPEAQNALLKTFEEPTPDTHFFVMARDENMFLSTLLSRMHITKVPPLHDVSDAKVSPLQKEAEAFLKMSLAKRIIFARKFADEKEERGAGALTSFLDSLLLNLKKGGVPIRTLEKIFKIRLFAEDPSAMSRLIIEHLALVLG